MDAMPMGYQQTGVFLHHKAVQGLQLQLASEEVTRTLKVKDYTLRDMAKDLNATYRKYMAVSRGTEISFQDLVRHDPIQACTCVPRTPAAHQAIINELSDTDCPLCQSPSLFAGCLFGCEESSHCTMHP